MALQLKDVWRSAVIDFGYISVRILWIKFKFSRVKVYNMVGYTPNEGIGEERERFCNDTDRTVDRVGNGFRLCLLRGLNR